MNNAAKTALLILSLSGTPLIAAAGTTPANKDKSSSTFTVSDALRQVYLDQAEVDRVTAIVRSKADLERYLAHTPTAPLNRLPSQIKHGFIEHLVFTKAGLGSYSYAGLKDYLSASEIYQTLSLFGVQKSIGEIPGLQARNETEKMIASLSFENCDQMGPEGSPTCPGKDTKPDNVCADDGLGDGYKCQYSFGDICTSACGK